MSSVNSIGEPEKQSSSIDKGLVTLLITIGFPLSSTLFQHPDSERNIYDNNISLSPNTLVKVISMLESLGKRDLTPSQDELRSKLTETNLQERDDYFETFAIQEEIYLYHARIHRELQKLVPGTQIQALNTEHRRNTIRSYSRLARRSLRCFFADNMTIIIGNLFIVTLASFFLGIGITLMHDEGTFWSAATIHHSSFSLALADCLFRLNAVHQAFIPYLRNGEGSPRVWKFFTAFIMSALMALVALGLLFKSTALHYIVNFVGAWGLMVGVWILLENERQM